MSEKAMADAPRPISSGKPRKGMGSYRDELGRLWRFWRGAWRKVKEKPRGKRS